MRQMTSRDIMDYAEKQVHEAGVTGLFVSIADAWMEAKSKYTDGLPDTMIKLLRAELQRKEEDANDRGGREICSGPAYARGEAAEKARHIVALLWRIAEEYDPERVWGTELVKREVERELSFRHSEKVEHSELERVIHEELQAHCQKWQIIFVDLDTAVRNMAVAVERLLRTQPTTAMSISKDRLFFADEPPELTGQ